MKLMIVDDHSGIRKKINEILARPDLEKREFATGEQAIRATAEFQPDWIIIDVNLPGVNGFEVTKTIRKQLPTARVIIISSEGRNYLREQALAVGAEGFLSKHHLAELPRMLYGESANPSTA